MGARRFVSAGLMSLCLVVGVLLLGSAQALAAAPVVEEESVSNVAVSSATFHATLNPGGVDTTYRFEDATQGGSYEPVRGPEGEPLAGAAGDAGEGIVGVPLEVHIQNLSPSSSYRFRLVASSLVETVDGADESFVTQRTGSPFALPDGRSLELVTPADKHGALFYSQDHTFSGGVGAFGAEASVNGGAMIDLASQPTEVEPQGYSNEVQVLSTRGASGWSSQVIATPHNEGTGPSIGRAGEYHFFSEDLSLGVVLPFGNFMALSPEATEATLYLRSDYVNGNVNDHCQTSCYRPLVTAGDTRPGAVFGNETTSGECQHFPCGPRFIDATPDASHVVLSSDVQLLSPPEEGNEGRVFYYEWSGGRLQTLYLLPESEGGVGVYAGELSSVTHQLSDGGSVFFSYGGHLYLHDFAKGESVRLDVAQGVKEPSEGGANFLYASSDGSRVLFEDSQQLTKAAGGGIYECRIVEAAGKTACELKLTGISGGTLIGGSSDASYLYFIGASDKLIIDHYDGREWTTTNGPFIGTQPESPANNVSPRGENGGDPVYRVSPNGRYLTFMSDEDLTGYDTRDALSGQPDQEVYLYDAGSNKLTCASCNPTGARPVGVEYKTRSLVGGSMGEKKIVNGKLVQRWAASNLPPWTQANKSPDEFRYQPRFLSDSGRLFFDSNDALVPQDVNGTQDVYEYEPAGVGTCTTSNVTFSERSNGCVGLVSSGSSPEESAFMDASATGGDVFFITLAKLTSQDFDKALDVYDAHECSADVPCYPPVPVSLPVCSTGDSCKAAPSPQPSIFGPAPSATFSGAGNISPSGSTLAVRPKSLTRAQKLANALKACRKSHRQRAVCERKARRRYGTAAGKSRKASAKQKGRG